MAVHNNIIAIHYAGRWIFKIALLFQFLLIFPASKTYLFVYITYIGFPLTLGKLRSFHEYRTTRSYPIRQVDHNTAKYSPSFKLDHMEACFICLHLHDSHSELHRCLSTCLKTFSAQKTTGKKFPCSPHFLRYECTFTTLDFPRPIQLSLFLLVTSRIYL